MLLCKWKISSSVESHDIGYITLTNMSYYFVKSLILNKSSLIYFSVTFFFFKFLAEKDDDCGSNCKWLHWRLNYEASIS